MFIGNCVRWFHLKERDSGTVTAVIAKEFVITKFEKYKVMQDKSYNSDFDKLLQNIET